MGREMRRSSTETIITAMRILAEDIQSEDGVANAAIREAADRLEELASELARMKRNRDMWKGQVARQSAELERLRCGIVRVGEPCKT